MTSFPSGINILCPVKIRKNLISLWLSPSNDGHDIFESASENDLIFTAGKDIWRGLVPELELVISAAQERRK